MFYFNLLYRNKIYKESNSFRSMITFMIIILKERREDWILLSFIYSDFLISMLLCTKSKKRLWEKKK